MVRASPVGPRWTIGQFSRMTLLSARMLRHYDRLGLLRPGDVDPSNGYRYYSRDELAPALMLRRPREAWAWRRPPGRFPLTSPTTRRPGGGC